MRDMMIDIETLGQKPGSVILSIGAVAFDAVTGEMGETFYAAIDPEDAAKYGLTVDVRTVKWWMGKSPEAQLAAFSGNRKLVIVLDELAEYVRRTDPTRVWAKPPSFDLVLLEAAFSACKIETPWPYWTCRDCRTLFDIAGVTPEIIGIAHNALDDAQAQALAVISACRTIASRTENGGRTDGDQ